MIKEFLLVLAAALLYALPARAVCTAHGTASTSSSQILSAHDLAGGNNSGLPWYLLILIANSGNTNHTGNDVPMYVAIGSGNAATISDIPIMPGEKLILTSEPSSSPRVPGDDVAVITAYGTTTWAVCDY